MLIVERLLSPINALKRLNEVLRWTLETSAGSLNVCVQREREFRTPFLEGYVIWEHLRC